MLADKSFEYLGFLVTIAGYGLINTNRGNPNTLLKTYRFVEQYCTHPNYYFPQNNNEDRAFCTRAGAVAESPCNGDSGSPVMVEFERYKLAIGVHSSSISPCSFGPRPWANWGFHVRISYYIDWIKEILCRKDGSKFPYMEYDCPSP